jgi:hypothetical protein
MTAFARVSFGFSHGSPLKVKSDKCAENRAKNTRAENIKVGWLFHG